jgi:hypothetical protein
VPCPAQVRGVRDRGGPWPIDRPADGEEAEFIAVALRFGKLYRNAAPAREGSGHRSCMIYSAIVCPYLASPGARRKFEVQLGPEAVPRGDPRGPLRLWSDTTTTPGTLAIRGWTSSTGSPLSFSATPAALTCSRSCTPRSPGNGSRPWRALLGDDAKAELGDDAKAELAAWAVLEGDPSPTQASRRQNQARKSRRKSARAARRRNRCLCRDRT